MTEWILIILFTVSRVPVVASSYDTYEDCIEAKKVWIEGSDRAATRGGDCIPGSKGEKS